MNARAWHCAVALIVLLLGFGNGFAQGFAGLGTDAEGFSVPEAGKQFQFPRDHGSHPDYRIEWWYLTANLTGPDGADYGLQWTLFRSALAPAEAEGWESPQLWFGHAAVTSALTHRATERFARGGTGQAGVTAEPFAAWIDDWQMAGDSFDRLRLTATGTDFAYDIAMHAQGPLVLHGDHGYSVKSAKGQASYYYSQPFFAVEGTLTLPEGEVPVHGTAWLDREWSSQPLAQDQAGWDWFSLSFDTGEKLMGFSLRDIVGGSFTSATWIGADGSTTSYGDGNLVATPLETSRVDGRDVPTRWRLALSDRALDVTVGALNTQAWMGLSIPYWEGPVRVTGTHPGKGYLEMTGYEPR
ncbi:lipocalin-like domain-containing protein [Mesorhizobium sp. YM1C-6-2]|uniref:lipocalin-like domain-containing protein n=1 Tax=Mesorhizobium sp. YM1C-6-2 TaxID=1827501 RepID=UPI000EF25B4A|nr:lipocalin-like domain-containing protein [Mesorhizobium sp. YM1C-6-2]RLP23100.1 iron ABC transporter permease [Mesorhizobium sp. YM1C-6-2]